MGTRGAGSDRDGAEGDAARVAALRQEPRRVVLVGNFGSVNLGDELLLSIIAGWAGEAGADVCAATTRPAWTAARYGVRSANYGSLLELAAELSSADLMVLAGGGLFQDYDTLAHGALERFPAYGATQFAQFAHLAGTLGVPTLALAQGVGPLRTDDARGVVRDVLDRALAISVRDRASADLVRTIGVHQSPVVAPDPAWAWSPPGHAAPALADLDARLAGRPVLALALRDWPFLQGWEPAFVQAFDAALPPGWACLWLDFQRAPPESGGGAPVDGIAARMIAALPSTRVHVQWQGNDVEEAYALLAQCDAALTMRLHATILAHKLGLPTAAIEYDDKVAALGRELGVPAVQRIAIDAIAQALPPAIGAVCDARRDRAFRLDRAVAIRLASQALMHRRVLHEAMGRATPRPLPASTDPRWLSLWHSHGEPYAPAVMHMMEGRLHRATLERHRAADALFAAQLDVSRLRSEVAAEAQARAEAASEAARQRTLYEAALASRSYRWTAPARALVASMRRGAAAPAPTKPPATAHAAEGVAAAAASVPGASIAAAAMGTPRVADTPHIDMAAGRRVDIINFSVFDWNGERPFNGGAERYVHDLALVCRDLGLEPRLLQNAVVPFERELGGIPVIGLPLASTFDLARMSAGYARVVADAAIVVASPVELAVRLPASPRIIGINHGIGWDLPSSQPGAEALAMPRLALEALQRIGRCVCVDTNFINWVRSHDWHAAQRLDYVPNYVDLAKFRPRDKDFDAERLLVLYPRRLYRARGYQDTLQACDTLMARGVPIDLHLCGGADGGDEALAQAFAMRWPGRLRRSDLSMDEMPRAYEDSHVALIPTNYSEGTSLSCIESLATRNGVIASNVGGLPNLVIDGYNGLLIAPGAAAIGNAIMRFADDRKLLAQVAARGVDVAQAFSRDAWRARWIEVLQRTMASRAT